MWLGVISDTNGALPARISEVFHGVDYILHCGGIGDPEILDSLSHIAPVTGVLGPQDDAAVYPFEKVLVRKWFDVGIYISHKIGDPMNLPRATKREIEKHNPQVVLFGHGPEPLNSRIENRLYFCPGIAGPRRGRAQRSVGIIEIDGRFARGQLIPIE